MSSIKVILIFIFYLVYSKAYEYLLLYLSNNGILANINSDYLYFADTFFCIPIIILYFIFFNQKAKPLFTGIDYKVLLGIFLLAITFKVVENPLTNINYIINNDLINILDNNKDGSLFYLVLLFFNTVLIVPFTEELLFRKMALSYFNSSLVFGLLFSSILFALIHIDVNVNFNLLTISKLLIMFLLGIFTGLVYLRYGFTHSFILHATYNFIWYLLNMYRIGYSKLLVDLNFDYRYWLIFGSCLIMLIRTLKKLNLSSPLLKKINS